MDLQLHRGGDISIVAVSIDHDAQWLSTWEENSQASREGIGSRTMVFVDPAEEFPRAAILPFASPTIDRNDPI